MTRLAAVVSSSEQFAALRMRTDFNAVHVFCNNPALEPWLKEKGIAYELLDDFSLQPDWNAVNHWGCEKAYGWIQFCREHHFFEEFDIPSATALFFSHFLIQGVKNYLFAEKIINNDYSRIFTFASAPRIYPRFSGSGYLNFFLNDLAAKRNIPVDLIAFSLAKEKPAKSGLSTRVTEWIRQVSPLFLPKSQPADFVFAGSLRHLQPVLTELKARQKNILLYEPEFHWDSFRRVSAAGIPYEVTRKDNGKNSAFDAAWAERMLFELDSAWKCAKDKGFFVWRGNDLSNFVKDQVFFGYGEYFKNLLPLLRAYETMLRKVKPKKIISDEDYALRGGPFAALARKMNVPFVTVSHANMAVDFEVPVGSQSFRQSTATLVNSENEKKMYIARGWDCDGFKILGTPRYDRLIEKRAMRCPDGRQIPRLLFCANTYFRPQKPDDYGYLGMHLDSFSKIVHPAACAILKAVEQSNCELVIKPHNSEGMQGWIDFIQSSSAFSRIRLIWDPKAQIIDLINQCDAMILSYWSTTIYEAMLCDIPVIYVDLLARDITALKDLESKRLLQVARTETEVCETVRKIKIWDPVFFQKRPEFDAEIGWCDGQSTRRVADFLTMDKVV